MTQITMMVWSFTESQISWSVKPSGSQEVLLETKLVEVMEFQLSYLKSQKKDAVKVLYPICQQIWKTQQWPQDWKRSVFFPIPKKGNAKDCSNFYDYAHFTCWQGYTQNLSSQASVVHELKTSICTSRILKRQRNQRSNSQHLLYHEESKGIPEKYLLLLQGLC